MEINANRADVYAAVAELIRTCDSPEQFRIHGRGMDVLWHALILVDGKLGIAMIRAVRRADGKYNKERSVRAFRSACGLLSLEHAQVIECDFDAVVRELETVNGFAYIY